MATKRKGAAKRGAGGKRGSPRRAQAARRRRPARRSARAGTRATRREEAARQIDRDVAANEPRGHGPELEQAPQPPPAAPWPGEAEGIPGYARLVAEPQDAQADRRRREEAEAELARRREAMERESRGGSDPAAQVPALREIGIELAIGAIRLARTVATAPLRIGLAFLRDR